MRIKGLCVLALLVCVFAAASASAQGFDAGAYAAPRSGVSVADAVTVDDTAVYADAYMSADGTDWTRISLSGAAQRGDWIIGAATSDQLPAHVRYLAVFSCSWTGAWNCSRTWQIVDRGPRAPTDQQGATDFSQQDALSAWSVLGPAQPSVITNESLTGGAGLRVQQPYSTRSVLVWDAIPDTSTYEVLLRVRPSGQETALFALGNLQERSTDNLSAFVGGVQSSPTNTLLAREYVDGSWTNLDEADVSAVDGWRLLRMRVDFDDQSQEHRIRVRIWEGALSDEPGSWALEVVTAAPLAPGPLGLFVFREGVYDVDFVTVGIGGASAPAPERSFVPAPQENTSASPEEDSSVPDNSSEDTSQEDDSGGSSGDGSATPEGVRDYPRGLHTRAQLDYVRARLDEQPYRDAWQELLAALEARADREPHAVEVHDVTGYYTDPDEHLAQLEALEGDAFVAYGSAVAYQLSGDDAYAERALVFLNDWAYTNKEVSFERGNNAPLSMTYTATAFVKAGELLRGYEGWSSADREQFREWVAGPHRNTTCDYQVGRYYPGNHHAWGIYGCMANAIYLDDEAKQQEMVQELEEIVSWRTIGEDCEMRHEVDRNDGAGGMHYSSFALEPMTAAGVMAYYSQGADVFGHRAYGRTIECALDYLLVYANNPADWPHFEEGVTEHKWHPRPGGEPGWLYEAACGIYEKSGYCDYVDQSRPIMKTRHHFSWAFPTLLPPHLEFADAD